MLKSGSYDIESFAIDKKREILRLNAQLDLFWEQEHSLYRRLGLRDGMVILDCGCGTGYFLEKLHGIYPSTTCFGVEISEFLFNEALNTIKAKKLNRCFVHKQSIMKLDLPENSFDFVIVRLVLEHLPDPVTAMLEVSRVLKVGGQAVFIDNDFDFHVHTFPEVSDLAELYSAYCKARNADGGNPRIGRQLPQLLTLAGYSDISFEAIVAHNAIAGDEAFQHSEGSGIALQLLRSGYLSNDTYEHLALNWSAMLKTLGHSITRLLFAGCGKKMDAAMSAKISNTSVTDRQTSNETLPKDITFKPMSTQEIADHLTLTVAQILEISPDKIQLESALGVLGLDSVGSVMLRNQIENDLRVAIPSLEFLFSQSINDLAIFIQSHTSDPSETASKKMASHFEEGEI
jgi:ubiquinone/menaquinone biosynthesis C-methylase UbiE/acyl carrier protein